MTKEQKAYIAATKSYHKQLALCMAENDLIVEMSNRLINIHKSRIKEEKKQKNLHAIQLKEHQNVFKNWKLKNKIK